MNPTPVIESHQKKHTTPILADLLEQIADLILEYVELAHRDLSMLLAVWIANTYIYECFDYCGYLHIQSPTPQCGKTTLLKCIRFLSKGKPPILTAPTAAVIFRSSHPVLLIDEAERLRDHDKENFGTLLTVLNAGVEREGKVERLEKSKKGGYDLESFVVYRPKALAGIEDIADTLESRSFHIHMHRSGKRLKRLRGRILELETKSIRDQLEQWAQDNESSLGAEYDKLFEEQHGLALLEGYDDRFQDLAEPLFILATFADQERAEGQRILPRFLAGLEAAWGRRAGVGREHRFKEFLALALKQLADRCAIFIPTSDLLTLLKDSSALFEITTANALAAFLKPFDLFPHSNGTLRGYDITQAWVNQWASRYQDRGRNN